MHIECRLMHRCVKFGTSTKIISRVININVKNKEGYDIYTCNTCDIGLIINVHYDST